MEEAIVFCGKQASVIIPNDLPALLVRKQQLLLQKSLAKKILNGSGINWEKRSSINLELGSINSELKALNVEIIKFQTSDTSRKRTSARKRFYDSQRNAAFPEKEDWESKYHWVRAQLMESMDLLCQQENLSPEEFEKKKKQIKSKIYTLTQWEKQQKADSFEAMEIINAQQE